MIFLSILLDFFLILYKKLIQIGVQNEVFTDVPICWKYNIMHNKEQTWPIFVLRLYSWLNVMSRDDRI